MNKDEIITALQSNITTFQNLISSFNETQLNQVPFEGSWTPAQVAQHIIMANSGFGDVLNGPVKDTSRAPGELKEKIKKDFLNFEIKMKSPDFILPKMKAYDRERQLSALEGIKNDISSVIPALDLTQTCLAFELPVYGHLTRLEAIWFVIYHTQRHAQQLRNIKDHYVRN